MPTWSQRRTDREDRAPRHHRRSRLLSEILPAGPFFSVIDKPLKKKEISRLINASFRRCGLRATVIFADKLMQFGYGLATRAGIFDRGQRHARAQRAKHELIRAAEAEVKEIAQQYTSGLRDRRRALQQGQWTSGSLGDQVAKAMMKQLGREGADRFQGLARRDQFWKKVRERRQRRSGVLTRSVRHDGRFGRAGSAAQIRQLAGMRGLMAKPDGSIIETPITTNFREGLNVLQYFISTHGARKGSGRHRAEDRELGLPDRRLVDVTQDLVVIEDDCGTRERLQR